MIGTFRRLPWADAERLLAEPELLANYLFPDDLEQDEDQPANGFGAYAELDIDKAWHGIHFLLTQSTWGGGEPLDFIVQGGTEIGVDDIVYSPPRAFVPDQVGRISSALSEFSPAMLRERYDAVALSQAEVYPGIWSQDDESADYLVSYFESLKNFIAGAVSQGEALIVYLA